jgi:hypothetical protein
MVIKVNVYQLICSYTAIAFFYHYQYQFYVALAHSSLLPSLLTQGNDHCEII